MLGTGTRGIVALSQAMFPPAWPGRKPSLPSRIRFGTSGEEEIVRYPFRSTEFLGPGPVETLPNYTFPITFVSADAGTGVLADGAYTVTVASTSGSGTGLKLTMEISNKVIF